VQIPFIRTDTALLAFLSIQNEKDWDKARANPDNIKDMNNDTTVGCTKVRPESTLPPRSRGAQKCLRRCRADPSPSVAWQWRQLMIDDVQPVSGSERTIMDIWRQIERLEQVGRVESSHAGSLSLAWADSACPPLQTLSPLCSACKQLAERSQALANDMGTLRGTFDTWSKASPGLVIEAGRRLA
jgi:hypothetical protein